MNGQSKSNGKANGNGNNDKKGLSPHKNGESGTYINDKRNEITKEHKEKMVVFKDMEK